MPRHANLSQLLRAAFTSRPGGRQGVVCTIDTNHPAPSRRTGGAIRRSGSIKWGWSLSDPALCDSHLGCPAIYPNFLMTYEIIRLDRRPSWSVCGLRKCSITMWYRLQRCQGEEARLGYLLAAINSMRFCSVFEETRTVLHRDRNRLAPTQPQLNNSTAQAPGSNTRDNAQRVELAGRPGWKCPPPLPTPRGPTDGPQSFTLPRVSLCQSEMLAIPPSPPFRFDAPPIQTMPGYSYDQPAETPHTTRSHRH